MPQARRPRAPKRHFGDAAHALELTSRMAIDTSTVQVVMPAMGDSVAEGTVLLCVLVGLSLLIFSQDVSYTYLIFPPLIWAALRFRQLGGDALEPDRRDYRGPFH